MEAIVRDSTAEKQEVQKSGSNLEKAGAKSLADAGWTSTGDRVIKVRSKSKAPRKKVSKQIKEEEEEQEFEDSASSSDSDDEDAERQRRLALARKDARAILETADVISSRIKSSRDRLRMPDLPDSFGGEERLSLREHQVTGLKWLYHSRAMHINGILADEQGLGKTCQTIALLAAVKHASIKMRFAPSPPGKATAQRGRSSATGAAAGESGSQSPPMFDHQPPPPFFRDPSMDGRRDFWRPAGLEEARRIAAIADELEQSPPHGREEQAAMVRKSIFPSMQSAVGSAISVFQHVDEDMASSGTHLVIVPTSTLGNWQKEFDRWAPSLLLQTYRGSRQTKQKFISSLSRGHLPDVILTTYSQLEDDGSFRALQAKVGKFDYMVLDEAHGLKNAATRRYRRIAGVHSRQRLLLTGTPIQNNLVEVLTLLQFTLADLVRLSSGAMFQSNRGDGDDDDAGVAGQAKQAASEWALLNEAFVLELAARKKREAAAALANQTPVVAGAAASLQAQLPSSIGDDDAVSVVDSIRKTLSPFILRRTKKMVLSTLPSKILKSMVLPGIPVQQRMYAITRVLSARTKMLTEKGMDCHIAAAQSDGYAKRELLQDPMFIAGVTAPIPGLVEKPDKPFGYSGGVALRDFRSPCGLGMDRGGSNFGPAGMSVVMNLRKIANHPMLARALFPDWTCLLIARIIRHQELAQSMKTAAARKAVADRNPFEAVPALSNWIEVQRAINNEAAFRSGAGTSGTGIVADGVQPASSVASSSSSSSSAAASTVLQEQQGGHRPRRSAASAAAGSMNEDAMFKKQEAMVAMAMHDGDSDAKAPASTSQERGEAPAKRARTSAGDPPASCPTASVADPRCSHSHPRCPLMPTAASLSVPYDMIPELAPRYRRVSETLPAPSTSKELLVWARGDKRLANIAEEVLGYSDYDLHQICESEPLLRDISKMSKPYLLQSCKAGFLRRCVKTLGKRKEKLLVFSQFTSILSIYEDVLDGMKVGHLRLDGSTNGSDRQMLIDRFTVDDTVSVFLLSTKAGGVGLNLTAASCLIINDLDWNPHNDAQAEDRCHRIGQTKQVHVFRLSMAQTIEQRMDEVAQDKQRLKRALLSDGPSSGAGSSTGARGAEIDKESLLRAELEG